MERQWIELAHGWKFLRDEEPEARLRTFDDSTWDTVSIPHCFNAADTCITERVFYRGPAWYRIKLPSTPKRARIELKALGAFSVTQVWLNGERLGTYMGGYTGFTVDLTPHLKKKKNMLALRVTNTHNADVLPGKDNPDYTLYGGIYREIGLNVTNPLHIPDDGIIVTTPDVSKKEGHVHVNVRVRNDGKKDAKGTVTVQVRSPKGKKVVEAQQDYRIAAGVERLISVPLDPVEKPQLWSPDEPNLYSVRVRLEDKNDTVDDRRVPFGFRWFRFDVDKGFFLNGKPVKLNGVNRHQDFPGLGNALPAALQSHDVELLKETGVNFVRCSHYPMHPAFLDACDRFGIMLYTEIASWQYIGGERFAQNAEQMMEEMIARDRHHPSIILWGLLNEGRSRALFDRLHQTAKRMDPWRPTVYAENSPEEGVELGTVYVPDVIGINYKVPHLDELRELLHGICLMNSEHSNANTGERTKWEGGGEEKDWVDDELWQLDKILHDLDAFAAREWMAGSALWCMHDYGTEYEVSRPIQRSGCFDAWRIPKLSAHAIRARWNDTPFTRILGHWTWPGGDGEEKRVVVASNAERVELLLNDRSLGTKGRKERTTDGIFEWLVPYAPGELKAVAHHGDGHGSIEDSIVTAGKPASLMLDTTHEELPANGTDIAYITATVVDANGVWCPGYRGTATFRTDGDATFFGLYGKPDVALFAGRGRIALRAGQEKGTIKVVARADGIAKGSVKVRLR